MNREIVDTLEFRGEPYTLNQAQENIYEWIDRSKPGEFTYYYDKVVFHTERDGYIAAYRDDLDNYFNI